MTNKARSEQKLTYTKTFDYEDVATAYWKSVGTTHRGGRVVKNELEYKRDGSFEVVTVVMVQL